MGFLDIFKTSGDAPTRFQQPEVGICKATRGDLGIWVAWNPQKPNEVYRIVVTAYSPYRREVDPPFCYTFAPAHQAPFIQYIEGPWYFKEFLRGKDRVTTGQITIDVLLSDNQVVSRTYPLQEVLKCYLSKGPKPPAGLDEFAGARDIDTPQVASIKPQDLKKHSEDAKRALEEKRRKEEEERKAREAAKAEAERKAQEAKAKAEAAAKAAAEAKKSGAAPAAAEAGPTLPPCKVAIIYGTSTGNTANVAEMIKAELSDVVEHCKAITEVRPSDIPNAEILILGVPTWHIGEMQDDWAAVLQDVAAQNYQSKKVAIFGLGDGKGYPETYVDAMQELWEKFEKKGATLVGLWPTTGYEFQKSKAIKDGKFLGLVIDVENQDHMTEDRVKRWTAQIRKELGL